MHKLCSAVLLCSTISFALTGTDGRQPKCKLFGEYCQLHSECCSTNCLSYSYKCINAYPPPIPNAFPLVNRVEVSPIDLSNIATASNVEDLVKKVYSRQLANSEKIIQDRENENIAAVASIDKCKAIGEKCFDNSSCCSNKCPSYLNKCVS